MKSWEEKMAELSGQLMHNLSSSEGPEFESRSLEKLGNKTLQSLGSRPDNQIRTERTKTIKIEMTVW